MGKGAKRTIVYEGVGIGITKITISAPLGKPMTQALERAVEELEAQGYQIIAMPKSTNGKRSRRRNKPPTPRIRYN